MKKLILAIFTTVLVQSFSFGQLANGSTAPNFTLDDIDGVSHDLYDILADGRGAIIDFSATWCSFCWNYHNTGILEDVWDSFGPSGTNETMVFFIEPDPSTAQSCLFSSSSCSWGDWTAGVNYPILNPGSADANAIANDYNLAFFPTLYAVGPNYKVYLVGQASYTVWSRWVDSFTLTGDYTISGQACDATKDIELSVSGGWGTKSYSWSNGSSSQNLFDAPPGTYYVTITDANNYDISLGPILVENNFALSVELDDYEDVSCNGDNDGFLSVFTFDGSGNYSYNWSTGASADAIYNLYPGVYELTVTDNNTGCEVEESYEIAEPLPLDYFYTTDLANCQGEDGTLYINTVGGNTPYKFYLDNELSNFSTIFNVDTGTYLLRIVDFKGCELTSTVTMEQYVVPKADTIAPDILTCALTQINLSADSTTIGEHIVNYWFQDTILIDTGYQITTMLPGSYTLLVKDTISTCADTLDIIVEQDIMLPTATTAVSDQLTCTTTQIQVSGIGSSVSDRHTYIWSSQNGSIVSDTTSLDIQVDSDGEYVLTVLDTINNCIAKDTSTVVADTQSPQLLLLSTTNIDCQNPSGEISVMPTQNTSYSWTTTGGIIQGSSTNPMITVLAEGSYTLTALNTVNGCESIDSFAITASTELPQVAIATPTLLTCNTQQITLSTPNNTNYSYQWSTPNGNIIGDASLAQILTDQPGEYLVEVTDMINGCVKSASTIVSANQTNPTVTLVDKQNLTCVVDIAQISVEELVGHTYTWSSTNGTIATGANQATVSVSKAGTYTVNSTNTMTGCTSMKNYNVIEDTAQPMVNAIASGILTCKDEVVSLSAENNSDFNYLWSTADGNILNTATASTVEVDQIGTYTLLTTDMGNGCTATTSVEIEENTALPSVTLEVKESLDCQQAAASIRVSANPSYRYTWSTDEGEFIGSQANAEVYVSKAGTYSLQVEDTDNGCTNTYTYTVEYSQAPPTLQVFSDGYVCKGAEATVCIDTNSDDITWEYGGGIYNTDSPCLYFNGPTEITITATNSLGCTSTESISIVEIALPSIAIDGDQVLDCVSPTSLLEANVDSDNPSDYTFEWYDTQNNIISTSSSIEVAQAGMYSINVTQVSTGCVEYLFTNISLDETTVPLASFENQHDELTVIFSNTSEGQIDTYTWTFGDGNTSTEANPTHTFAQAGYYTVCLDTENKCGVNTTCNQVLASTTLTFNTSKDDVTCHGFADGAVDLTVLGGLMPYSYSWSGPNGYTSTEASIAGLAAGEYTVNITDAGDGLIQFTANVKQPDLLTVNGDVVGSSIWEDNGMITLDIDGGTGSTEVLWNTGSTDKVLSDLPVGEYSVVVTDANGCTAETLFTITNVLSDTQDIEGIESIAIYPSPAVNTVNIRVDFATARTTTLLFTDAIGTQIFRSIHDSTKDIDQQLDVSHLPTGIYFVQLLHGNATFVQKVAILK